MTVPLLEARELSKQFPSPKGTVQALEGVTLRLAAGEFVAVQGPSGSGKTTLLLALGGLLKPDTGRLVLDGVEPYALDADGRARLRAEKIGFVFQEYHLIPYLTVLENVLVASLPNAAANPRPAALGLIDRLGLSERAEHTPAALSSGERQRVALARSLLNGPCLLLADEPTGNLDRENMEIVLGCLAEFTAGDGAVLLATHDEGVAGRADRRFNLRAGRLVGV